MSAQSESRPSFTVVFRPLSGIDGIRALRQLLKAALRRHGLRAVSVKEESQPVPDAIPLDALDVE